MAKFTTRIVLHNAGRDDYSDLYTYMDQEGFSDAITSGNGNTYKMPDGEYDIQGSFDLDGVMKKAKRAAGKTGKEYVVFITESSGRKWIGLNTV